MLEIWVDQHKRGGQPTAKLFKGPFPLLRPAKRGSTLCKTVQWLGHVRELWNKPSVIPGKAQEPLDLLGSGWCWPFCNFLHLRWVRSNTISGYDMPQVLDHGLEKSALCGFQLQPSFSETGERCPQILQVFCECLPKDDNIVQVHQTVAAQKVKCTEPMRSDQSVQGGIDMWEGISIFPGHLIELPVIDAEAGRAVFLLYQDDGGGPGASRPLDDVFGQHLSEEFLHLLSAEGGDSSNRLPNWRSVSGVNRVVEFAGAAQIRL